MVVVVVAAGARSVLRVGRTRCVVVVAVAVAAAAAVAAALVDDSVNVGSTGVEVLEDRPLGGGFGIKTGAGAGAEALAAFAAAVVAVAGGGAGVSLGSMDGVGLPPSVSSRFVLTGTGIFATSMPSSAISRGVSLAELGVACGLAVLSLMTVFVSVVLSVTGICQLRLQQSQPRV